MLKIPKEYMDNIPIVGWGWGSLQFSSTSDNDIQNLCAYPFHPAKREIVTLIPLLQSNIRNVKEGYRNIESIWI